MRRDERYSPTGPHASTAFSLRLLVDVVDCKLGLRLYLCSALSAPSLRLLSDFSDPGRISFAWGGWLSVAALLDTFFLCCRPRLSASFCFCRYRGVSIGARYHEMVPKNLQRSFRLPGLFVRGGSRLALLHRIHNQHNIRGEIGVGVIKPGR